MEENPRKLEGLISVSEMLDSMKPGNNPLGNSYIHMRRKTALLKHSILDLLKKFSHKLAKF